MNFVSAKVSSRAFRFAQVWIVVYLAQMTGNQSGAEKDNRLSFREQ